jgi:hypothetical protein
MPGGPVNSSCSKTTGAVESGYTVKLEEELLMLSTKPNVGSQSVRRTQMLRPISTAVVVLSLAASTGQAATLTGDHGASSANQAVGGDQGAKQDRGFVLTIIGDKGTTFVNRGTGFSAVAGNTQLRPGDRIMVRDGAAARITYPDGCNVPVRGLATVDPLSPCNFMAADLPPREPPPEPYVAPVAEEFPYWPVAVTVLAFGGAAACVALCSHHNDNFPFFPVIPVTPLSP